MGLKDQAVAWRRYFHQFPELSDKEFKTTQKIKDILTEYNIRILDLPLATGLVAEVGQGLSCIAVRADIDALPIQELVEQDFKSENEGVMHACGHDIHMASILATAVKLKEIEGTLHGAFKIIETHALQDVQAVLGFHNDPSRPVGTFAIKTGAITSAVDRFEFHIKGVGGHAAKPEQCNDPVIVLAQLINSIQSIVSRNLSAFDEAVVTIGQISCGNTWNVIADHAYVQGTVRSFDPVVRKLVETRLQDIADGLAQAYNMKINLNYTHLPGAVMNDEALTHKAIAVA